MFATIRGLRACKALQMAGSILTCFIMERPLKWEAAHSAW